MIPDVCARSLHAHPPDFWSAGRIDPNLSPLQCYITEQQLLYTYVSIYSSSLKLDSIQSIQGSASALKHQI